MLLIGILAALAVPSETWICQLEKDDADGGYETTFVVGDDRVIETGLLPYGYELLEDNGEHLTFARSQYNAMLNAGFRLDQIAVVVTIDRSTNAVKKIFLQDHGERTSVQRGTCHRIEV
jgi:hypothetical protein